MIAKAIPAALALGAVLAGGPVALAGTEPPPDDATGASIEIVGGPEVDDLTFEVEGTGWPASSLVQLELCGNEARNGSVDCVASTAQTVASNFEGWFRGRVSSTAPPVPCPCVVRAIGQSGALIATAAVRVAGVPELLQDEAEQDEAALRRIGIIRARLDGEGPWQAWLGGAPRRTLTLRIVNSGTVAIDDARLVLGVGSGDSPTGFVPPIALDRLDVGAATQLEVDVEFDALAFGELAVFGEITGTTEPTTFEVTTTSYPWLLVIVPLFVVVQLMLLRGRNAVRRRAFPEPVVELPALPSGVREVEDAIFLISVVKDVEAEFVMTIQALLRQTSFIVPDDRTCGPAMFAVRGVEAVQELLRVVVDETRSDPDDPLVVTELLDVVHVAAIAGTTPDEARAAAGRLGDWLQRELEVDVRIDDVGDRSPLPPPGCLRIVSGPPPVLYRIDLAGDVARADAIAVAGRISVGNISARLLGSSPVLCIRVNDWTKCRLDSLYDQVASAVPIEQAAPVGLVPLGALARIDPDRWAQLGLRLDDTYEVRIASGPPPEVPVPELPQRRELMR